MLDLTRLSEAVRHEGGVSRRLFLAYGAALSALPLLAGRTLASPRPRASFPTDPFSLGVASGDPTDTGVVLWTRLAPKPLDPDGGMASDAIDVQWEIASDAGMKDVVRVHYILPNAADFEKTWPILRKYFGDVRPAATMICAGLADPRMKIEIEVTALKSS